MSLHYVMLVGSDMVDTQQGSRQAASARVESTGPERRRAHGGPARGRRNLDVSRDGSRARLVHRLFAAGAWWHVYLRPNGEYAHTGPHAY
jgi:hypothetical protein